MLRLSRKADVDVHTRLITSIYLPEEEFVVLAESLPGSRIKKLRHRLRSGPDVSLLVDEFLGDLTGLTMAEAEFKTAELLAAYTAPVFAGREVTGDHRFNGGTLVKHGLPADLI